MKAGGELEVGAAEAGSKESSLCLDGHHQWSSSDEAQNQAWGDEDNPHQGGDISVRREKISGRFPRLCTKRVT